MDMTRPQDLDAERCLLSGLMYNNATADVEERDFDSDAHRLIFRAIGRVQARGEHPDVVTVRAELGSDLERAGGQPYLLRVYGADSLEVNQKRYAAIVRDCAVRRRRIEAGVRIAAAAESGQDLDAHRLLDDADRSGTNTSRGAGQLAGERCETAMTPRGYVWMNDFPGVHLHFGDLFILAARPSVGKSALALQLASEWAERHLSTRVYSLEMSSMDWIDRMIQQRTPFGTEELDRGLSPDEVAFVCSAMEPVRSWPLSVHDRVMSIDQVCADMRRFARQGGRVAIIDYLQLLVAPERGQSRYEAVTNASRLLKLTAMESGLLVVALSQLNRGGIDKDGKPREPAMADLRDSGALEQDADDIALLHRFDDGDLKTRDMLRNAGYILDHDTWPLCRLDFCKLRRGARTRTPLYFDGEQMRFVRVDRRL